jgi:AAA15 family ATPase/GTPase
MLIEFRVENHRSLRDEQVFTFEADHGPETDDPRPRIVSGHNKPLLPVSALYGPNASGKSNLLRAIGYMLNAIIQSHRLWAPDEGIPRDPFAWGPKRSEPSLYEMKFLLNNTRFEYGFVVDDQSFKEEWLHAWPHNRKQVWFEREENNKFVFGENLKGENKLIEGATRTNALFLSTAVQNKHAQLSEVFAWFRQVRTVNIQTRSSQAARIGSVVRYLKADWTTSLISMIESREDLPFFQEGEGIYDHFREMVRNADIGIVDLRADRTEEGRPPKLLVKHQSQYEDSWLPFTEESAGTRTLMQLTLPILQTLDLGGLLVVDELEASLHPILVCHIVRMFNDPAINKTNAQLLFSTHDTNLLSPTVIQPALHRDQVWLTEKDKEGATVVYPLTEIKPRKGENLERGYLQGRYGAIPILGNFIPLDE